MFEKLEEIRRKYDEVKGRLADPTFVAGESTLARLEQNL